MSHRLRGSHEVGRRIGLAAAARLLRPTRCVLGRRAPEKDRRPKRGRWGHKNKVVALVDRTGKTRASTLPTLRAKTLADSPRQHQGRLGNEMIAGLGPATTAKYKTRHLSRMRWLTTRKTSARPSKAIPGKVARQQFGGIVLRPGAVLWGRITALVAHPQRHPQEFAFRHCTVLRWATAMCNAPEAALKGIGGKRSCITSLTSAQERMPP